MKIISIRTKILTIVIAFLFLIGILFVVYSITTTKNYKILRLESIEKLVGYETEKVNKIISEIERSAVFYALGGELTFQSGLEEFGETLTIEYLKSFPAAIGGGFWFEPYVFNNKPRVGFYAFFDKKTDTVRLDDTFVMEDYDYHNKIWYREIIDNITQKYQIVWTKPYVDDSGSFSLMTTAGCGIYDQNNNLIAVSTVDWEINEIIKQLLDITPTKNSFVLLCVPEKDYVISSAHTNIFSSDSIKSIPYDIFASSFTLNGVKYFTFGRFLGNGWLLNIHIPENEIYADVERQNTQYSILIMLSSFFMLFAAYLFISAYINNPIKKLISDVEKIDLGNLDNVISIQSNDELGLFAKTFNKMTFELKKSINENINEREEKRKINTELEVAKEIQTSMLPSNFDDFADIKEFNLYASMVPARNVGGDFYDFFLIDKDNLAILVADVSGKGIPAALFMVISKTLIKYCSTSDKPNDILESVNKKLCQGNDKGMFVTSFMGIYNIPTGKFVFVNAGHNPPLLIKKDKTINFINAEPCMVLGFMDDTKYRQDEIILNHGDMLYLYTDGVTEAMNAKKELFGEERLINALYNNNFSTPKKLIQVVSKEVEKYCDGAIAADDITMLALKINDLEEQGNSLEIDSDIKNLNTLFKFINKELVKYGYNDLSINEIDIAVEETFVNINKFAYDNAIGNVKITICAKNELIITFEDYGKPFDPLKIKDPDLKHPLEDRDMGGLGIYMIKNLMDSVSYKRQDGKNIFKITKSLP